MTVRLPLALTAAVAAAALAGCGTQTGDDSTEDFTGEQRRVAQVVEDLQSAASESGGDEQAICSRLLTAELAEQIAAAGASCQDAVSEALDDTDSFELQVEKVTIDGDTATAEVLAERGDRDERVTLELARQGGSWRISDLG